MYFFLQHTLKDLKDIPGPKILHCLTVKGKGFKPAEKGDSTTWHAPGVFDKTTGEIFKKKTTKKKYLPNSKEKYMCAKHKKFFTEELVKWKKDIIKANNLGNLLNSSDDNVSSSDVVDQASSYTDKSVEMKALNRSRKLISKINSFLNIK